MPKPSPWKTTTATAAELGITARRLRDLRKQGLFKLGKHYRIVSGPYAAKPTYQWHCDWCASALEVPMEKRG
ncbi:MAG: DNA-binding protein [Leptolyngbyaceae cyanobacterium RM1_406_9]|nr:DNA-binding protein [Leptolyngbyaceae cyanobacterium RM1_406_9]